MGERGGGKGEREKERLGGSHHRNLQAATREGAEKENRKNTAGVYGRTESAEGGSPSLLATDGGDATGKSVNSERFAVSEGG